MWPLQHNHSCKCPGQQMSAFIFVLSSSLPLVKWIMSIQIFKENKNMMSWLHDCNWHLYAIICLKSTVTNPYSKQKASTQSFMILNMPWISSRIDGWMIVIVNTNYDNIDLMSNKFNSLSHKGDFVNQKLDLSFNNHDWLSYNFDLGQVFLIFITYKFSPTFSSFPGKNELIYSPV